jgi:hypothetical protein
MFPFSSIQQRSTLKQTTKNESVIDSSDSSGRSSSSSSSALYSRLSQHKQEVLDRETKQRFPLFRNSNVVNNTPHVTASRIPSSSYNNLCDDFVGGSSINSGLGMMGLPSFSSSSHGPVANVATAASLAATGQERDVGLQMLRRKRQQQNVDQKTELLAASSTHDFIALVKAQQHNKILSSLKAKALLAAAAAANLAGATTTTTTTTTIPTTVTTTDISGFSYSNKKNAVSAAAAVYGTNATNTDMSVVTSTADADNDSFGSTPNATFRPFPMMGSYSYDELSSSSKNICLGRGQKFQRRPANTYFRGTIDKYHDSYDQAIRDDKKFVINRVKSILTTEGYRFFKQYKSCAIAGSNGRDDGIIDEDDKVNQHNWIIVSDQEVLYKIGYSFRSGRKARNNKRKLSSMKQQNKKNLAQESPHQDSPSSPLSLDHTATATNTITTSCLGGFLNNYDVCCSMENDLSGEKDICIRTQGRQHRQRCNRKANIYFREFAATFRSLFETTEDKYAIVTMLISKLRKNGYRFFILVLESNKSNEDDGNKAITSFTRDKEVLWIGASDDKVYREVYDILNGSCVTEEEKEDRQEEVEVQYTCTAELNARNHDNPQAACHANFKRRRCLPVATKNDEHKIIPVKKRVFSSFRLPKTSETEDIIETMRLLVQTYLVANVSRERISSPPAAAPYIGEGGGANPYSSPSLSSSWTAEQQQQQQQHQHQQHRHQRQQEGNQLLRCLRARTSRSTTAAAATTMSYSQDHVADQTATSILEDTRLIETQQQQQQQQWHLFQYRQERKQIAETVMQRKALSGMIRAVPFANNSNFIAVTMRLHELSLKSSKGNLLTEFESLWLQTLGKNQIQDLRMKLQATKDHQHHQHHHGERYKYW